MRVNAMYPNSKGKDYTQTPTQVHPQNRMPTSGVYTLHIRHTGRHRCVNRRHNQFLLKVGHKHSSLILKQFPGQNCWKQADQAHLVLSFYWSFTNNNNKQTNKQTNPATELKDHFWVGWGSLVGRALDRHATKAGSITWYCQKFFSQSQFSVQAFLWCLYIPVCNHMH